MKIENIQFEIYSKMFFLSLIIFAERASSKDYPPIKHPKNGIFNWFISLSRSKKQFQNRKIFGFRVNTSQPDLIMIANDLADHLNLHDLNLTGKFADTVNDIIDRPRKRSANYLSLKVNKKNCPHDFENVYHFCKLTGINLNFEKYGIPSEHVDIILSNMIGYLPCGLLLFILGISSVCFYIIQIVLSFFFCKPIENSSPKVYQFILFYIGDAVLLVSAIFYFFSYDGIHSFTETMISIESILYELSSSLTSSFHSVTKHGIPNSFNPVVDHLINATTITQNYLADTSNSFINPTIDILEKLCSKNEEDLGVFSIYNYHIYILANEFYSHAEKYPKLKDISKYFAKVDFTPFQNEIQKLLDKELEFAEKVNQLNSFFEYLNSTITPYQQFVANFTHQKVKGTNKTFGEYIDYFDDMSKYYLKEMSRSADKKSKLCSSIRVAFFILGVILICSSFFFAIVYIMHNKFSICVASTISIFSLIMTVLMFAIAFVFTEFGSADVNLSEQFEPAIDTFCDNVIGKIIPIREIEIPMINVTKHTNNFYKGIIKLSNIVLPNPFQNIQYFVNANKSLGIADSLQLWKIADLSRYGDEVGDFIINLGKSFVLPENLVSLIDNMEKIFRYVKLFPKRIDGLFNWGVPITTTTKHLRLEITVNDYSALKELEPYLNKIDSYVTLMNSQYQIALHKIYDELADALNELDIKLIEFIRNVMNNLGSSIKILLKNVYPVLNIIQTEPIVGPYAQIRNIVFYDLAGTSAYLSISGTLMMVGLVFIVVFMWIRRKGMLHYDNLQLRRDTSSRLDSTDNLDDFIYN